MQDSSSNRSPTFGRPIKVILLILGLMLLISFLILAWWIGIEMPGRETRALRALNATRIPGDAKFFDKFRSEGPSPGNDVRFGESLVRLRLTKSATLTDESLDTLRDLPGLTEIVIDHPAFTDANLASLQHCPKLFSLTLDGSPITDAGLAQLATVAPRLGSLSLRGTKVTDEGLAALLKLRNLHALYLQRAQITPEQLRTLQSLPHLKLLDLTGTKLDNTAVPILADFKSLVRVILTGTALDATGKAELKRLQPKLFIDREGR